MLGCPELLVQVDDVQYVQQLPLVLVEPLDLTLKMASVLSTPCWPLAQRAKATLLLPLIASSRTSTDPS